RKGQREEHAPAIAQEDAHLAADQGASAAGEEWDGGHRWAPSVVGCGRWGWRRPRVVCTNRSSRLGVRVRTCAGIVAVAGRDWMTAGGTSGVPVTRYAPESTLGSVTSAQARTESSSRSGRSWAKLIQNW